MKSITNFIDIDTIKDRYIYQMWNSIAPILKAKHVVDVKQIEPGIAYKYRSDFEGLLHFELKIHKDFTYPTMLVNGISASYDYRGEAKNILILDDRIMYDYLIMFARNLKEKNKLKYQSTKLL